MSQTAYLVSCVVLCGEGSDGALEGMERAYFIVGVNAANEDDALTKVEADFEDEGYALVECEWVIVASEMEWDDAEGKEEGEYIIARLETVPDEVVYGSLYEVPEEGAAEAA